MGALLAECKRTGCEFEFAWQLARKQIVWPHDTVHRRQWRKALDATKHEWRACYEGTETRLGQILRDFDPELFFVEEDGERENYLAA